MKRKNVCEISAAFVLTILLSITIFDSLGAQENYEKIFISHKFQIQSKILNESRDIFIHLPDNYDQSKERYPQLYVLDGEKFFEHAVSIVNYLSKAFRIPEMIVVGIPNTNTIRDLSINPQRNGRADNFLKFLDSELLPYVNSEYRTNSYRILFGHSLGAIVSIFALLSEQKMFNACIAASPMIGWYGVWDITGYYRENLNNYPTLNKSLFVALGDEPLFSEPLKEFQKVIQSFAPKSFRFKYLLMKEDDFDSTPFKTIYFGLEYIFSGWLIPSQAMEGGSQIIYDHYKKLGDRLGLDLGIPEKVVVRRLRRLAFDLNKCQLAISLLKQLRNKYAFKGKLADHDIDWIGYKFLEENKYYEAISVFQLNVELYPDLPNVYNSLGEAFEKKGESEHAKENYQMAYEKAKQQNDQNLQMFKQNLDCVSQN